MIPLPELLAKLADGIAPQTAPKCPRCDSEVSRIGRLCSACERAEARDHRQRCLRLARESIPPAFRGLDAQEVRRRAKVDSRTLETVAHAIARQRVVLVGASGFGKTTLACWMLQQTIDGGLEGTREDFERARRAFFVDTSGLCRAVRDHPLGHGDAPLLERALSASVLVLDDVGQELELRMACNPVVEVIRERHAAQRTTWATTFLAPDALERAYGSGTARRVFDGAEVIAVRAGIRS